MALPARARALVESLGLSPHPEGGFYKRTYTAPTALSTPRGSRATASAILFLLPAGDVSRLHELTSDELWFHHEGDALTVVELHAGAAGEDARVTRTLVGGSGAPSHAVGAGAVFGAACEAGGAAGFSLVSCVVTPGFDFADWRMDGAEDLRARFRGAAAAAAIAALARD